MVTIIYSFVLLLNSVGRAVVVWFRYPDTDMILDGRVTVHTVPNSMDGHIQVTIRKLKYIVC